MFADPFSPNCYIKYERQENGEREKKEERN